MQTKASSLVLNFDPLEDQCADIARRAPEPLSSWQRLFLSNLIVSDRAELSVPLLISVCDADFSYAIMLADELPSSVSERIRARILQRAMDLGCLSIPMARNNLDFCAKWRGGKLFAEALRCALKDTITRNGKRALSKALLDLANAPQNHQVADQLAPVLKDHARMLLNHFPAVGPTPQYRSAIVMMAAAGDHLDAEERARLRAHMKDFSAWFKPGVGPSSTTVLKCSRRRFHRLSCAKENQW
jgi:hypothetical protein